MKNTSNLITGFFLVILGILLLLRNLNILDFDIVDILSLIYIGVEMLPVEPKVKLYLQIGVIILFFIALMSLPVIREQSHRIFYDYETSMNY